MEVGLRLKKESMCSSRFLIYGKDLYYNGIQLSTLLKRVCRVSIPTMANCSNAFFPLYNGN